LAELKQRTLEEVKALSKDEAVEIMRSRVVLVVVVCVSRRRR
jgi:hypothetical protein